MDRCRGSRADPDASNTATTPATNEGAGRVSNGDCNGKVNNGVNKDVVATVNNENNHDNGNAADTERLELLSSSKGQGNCVSVVDGGGGGTKSGSMV